MERKNKGQQLSKEELAEIRSRHNNTNPVEAENKKETKQPTRSFIAKLKDSEISKFFERFGYINHERLTDKSKNDYLHIICDNMEIIMNDYDIGVSFYPEIPSTAKFKYDEFQKICRTLGISESKAMADIITSQFMTPRFPSYAEKRHNYQVNLINEAFDGASKGTRAVLSPLMGQQLAEAKAMKNVGEYGTFDIEEFLINKYGEN